MSAPRRTQRDVRHARPTKGIIGSSRTRHGIRGSHGHPLDPVVDLDGGPNAPLGIPSSSTHDVRLDALQAADIEAAQAHLKTLRGERARNDFKFFVQEIWGHTHPGYRKLINLVHDRVYTHVQDCILEWEWVRDRAAADPAFEAYIVDYALEMFRGGGKSLIGTIAGSAWGQLRNPDASFVIDSRTMDLSIAFLSAVKERLKGRDATSRFVEYYGNWFSQERTWDQMTIVHSRRDITGQIEPSYDCSANNSSQTSRHPDGVFHDDPVNENDNEADLTQAVRHHRSWPNIVRVPGFRLWCGTPYAVGDVDSYMHDNESGGGPGSWQWLSIPVLTTNEAGDEESVAPLVRPLKWLQQKRLEDPVNFASQYMLRPGEGMHTPLTLVQLRDCMVRVVDVPTHGFMTLHLDLQSLMDGKSAARGDSSVIAGAWHTDYLSYVVHLWARRRPKWEDFIDELATFLRLQAHTSREPFLMTMDAEIGMPKGSLDRLFWSELARRGVVAPRTLYVNRSTGPSKEKRIRLSAGQWASGRARIVGTLPYRDDFFFQMTHIGTSGHDDIADALSDMWHPRVRLASPFIPASDRDPDTTGDAEKAEWPLHSDVIPLPSQALFNRGVPPYNGGARHAMDGPHYDIDAILERLMREE